MHKHDYADQLQVVLPWGTERGCVGCSPAHTVTTEAKLDALFWFKIYACQQIAQAAQIRCVLKPCR